MAGGSPSKQAARELSFRTTFYPSLRPMISTIAKRRLVACGLVPLVVAFGLSCKYYRGTGSDWINNWGPASVAYVLLFMLLVFIVVPQRSKIVRIAFGVCVGTCIIEFLQLWKLNSLEAIRMTRAGRLVLGNSFSYWDFPAYFIGCTLGFFLLRGICTNTTPKEIAPSGRTSRLAR